MASEAGFKKAHAMALFVLPPAMGVVTACQASHTSYLSPQLLNGSPSLATRCRQGLSPAACLVHFHQGRRM